MDIGFENTSLTWKYLFLIWKLMLGRWKVLLGFGIFSGDTSVWGRVHDGIWGRRWRYRPTKTHFWKGTEENRGCSDLFCLFLRFALFFDLYQKRNFIKIFMTFSKTFFCCRAPFPKCFLKPLFLVCEAVPMVPSIVLEGSRLSGARALPTILQRDRWGFWGWADELSYWVSALFSGVLAVGFTEGPTWNLFLVELARSILATAHWHLHVTNLHCEPRRGALVFVRQN